jgi:hypothetical protein
MKLRPVLPGEYRYAVAVEEGADLWLTLWVRRSPRGEFFVMRPRKPFIIQPRRFKPWDPHTSYHRNGTVHMKSYDSKMLTTQCQPLTGSFRDAEDLGYFAGHDAKRVGEVCDPKDFNGVVKVAPGVLMPGYGVVKVDLVGPGHKPVFHWTVVDRQIFRDFVPWVVITVGSTETP